MSDPAQPLDAATSQATQAILDRQGLPAACLRLLPGCPRESWAGRTLHETAAHWLHMHGWFRATGADLIADADALAAGAGPADYFRQTAPRLSQYLQTLHGHHDIESRAYFPAFRKAAPDLAEGFAVLDRDHDAIHGVLAALSERALALQAALRSGAPAAKDAATRLADVVRAAQAPLLRHLDDEENLVIPAIETLGDPFGR